MRRPRVWTRRPGASVSSAEYMKKFLGMCVGLAVGLSCMPALARGVEPQQSPDTWSVNRTRLQFGGLYYSFALYRTTPAQSLRLTFDSPAAAWTASATAPWITVSHASGTGSATIKIGVRGDTNF